MTRVKKKSLALLLVLTMLTSLLPASLAAEAGLVVALRLNSPWCVVGSEVRQVDAASAAVTPVAENSRTLLPVSPIVEAFGGQSAWDAATNNVIFTLEENRVELQIGSPAITVNGVAGTMDAPAKAMNNRTYVPVRAVLEGLGLTVEYEAAHQIVVVSNGALDANALTALPQVQALVEKTTPKEEPLKLTQQAYTLPSGTMSANVITVNMADSRVSVRASLAGGKLNAPQPFSSIVANSGAQAVINANFFESNKDIKDPIGHVMAGGQFLYASSGLTSLGITADGEMRWGRPAVFVRVKTADGGAAQEWAAFEVNALQQFSNQSVLYTPVRGASFPVTYAGAVLVVENGVTTAYRNVAVGETVSIPANGFVLYSSAEVIATDYYRVPELGRAVVLEPYLFKEDAEGFSLDGVQAIVSGAPRLVKDGVEDHTVDNGFSEARFSGGYSAPRTAVGTTADGKLLLVNTASATIQQMRELMVHLGCVDAVNLDGGASAGMYYKGQTLATPGRNLTVTLQVMVSG